MERRKWEVEGREDIEGEERRASGSRRKESGRKLEENWEYDGLEMRRITETH